MDEMIDILEETFFNEIEATGDIPFFDDTKWSFLMINDNGILSSIGIWWERDIAE
jgi:hypothetical protein